MKRKCWEARKLHWAQCKLNVIAANLKAGKTLVKSKKLYVIKGVRLPEKTDILVGEDASKHVVDCFRKKWKSDYEVWSGYTRFIDKHRGAYGDFIDFSETEFNEAFVGLKKHRKLDREGVCMALLKLFHEEHGLIFRRLIGRFVWDWRALAQCELVHGRVFGKESHVPEPSSTRSILPLSCILKLRFLAGAEAS